MPYTPPIEQLDRYARLLVEYALGGGAGIAPGDVVIVSCDDTAQPLYEAACRAIWRAGGHVLSQYAPDSELRRQFFEIAGDEQLDFFAEHYWRGVVDQADHLLRIHSDRDPHRLDDVDPARLVRARRSQRPYSQWRNEKELAGDFTWTIGLYGTDAMAAEAGMTIGDYWQEIVNACFLDEPDPAARWRTVDAQIQEHCAALNALPLDRLHVEGEDVDLWVTVGEQRRWLGGEGRNVPSFEVFTSPDWRGTEGRIRFSEPVYVLGALISGVELEFREGRVTSARAAEGQALLEEMIAIPGADRVGEFSLTDGRLSPIRRFMANTLYDENTGGPFGNTHLALGYAIRMAYDGDPGALDEADWERLGFNEAPSHTDIVSTTDRTVTATLRGGGEQVIYESGRFTV